MKKFVSGLLVGFLLAIPAFAVAEQVSMIGKKVQNEYPVIVDGEQLKANAIAIDGTSYAPLRVIGEAIGYDVKFQDKTVVFTAIPKLEQPVSGEGGHVETRQVQEQGQSGIEYGYTLETITEAIRNKEEIINEHLKMAEYLESRFGPSPETEEYRASIEQAKKDLENLKQIKAELEAQQQK